MSSLGEPWRDFLRGNQIATEEEILVVATNRTLVSPPCCRTPTLLPLCRCSRPRCRRQPPRRPRRSPNP
ncbi:hypothetical protein VTN77DRAFT_5031 [Rasamsonia byssochlamydoides]|uniref:uncharacterized protein n=1 Tax=Rasamsonia byssochlamydoides TaxID=89139 RepID=UPI003742D214